VDKAKHRSRLKKVIDEAPTTKLTPVPRKESGDYKQSQKGPFTEGFDPVAYKSKPKTPTARVKRALFSPDTLLAKGSSKQNSPSTRNAKNTPINMPSIGFKSPKSRNTPRQTEIPFGVTPSQVQKSRPSSPVSQSSSESNSPAYFDRPTLTMGGGGPSTRSKTASEVNTAATKADEERKADAGSPVKMKANINYYLQDMLKGVKIQITDPITGQLKEILPTSVAEMKGSKTTIPKEVRDAFKKNYRHSFLETSNFGSIYNWWKQLGSSEMRRAGDIEI
jgi:hypothetical protein